jgi:hypothetical protein
MIKLRYTLDSSHLRMYQFVIVGVMLSVRRLRVHFRHSSRSSWLHRYVPLSMQVELIYYTDKGAHIESDLTYTGDYKNRYFVGVPTILQPERTADLTWGRERSLCTLAAVQ